MVRERLGVWALGRADGAAIAFWVWRRETLGAETGAARGGPLRRLWYSRIPAGRVEDGSICELHIVCSGVLGIGPLARTAAVDIVYIPQWVEDPRSSRDALYGAKPIRDAAGNVPQLRGGRCKVGTRSAPLRAKLP